MDFNLFQSNALSTLPGILIDGVDHVQDLQSLPAQIFHEMRRSHHGDALTSDVVCVSLARLRAVDVLLQTDLLITPRPSVESQQFCNLRAVGGVFMEAKFQALA